MDIVPPRAVLSSASLSTGARSLLEAECGHFFLAEQLQSVVVAGVAYITSFCPSFPSFPSFSSRDGDDGDDDALALPSASHLLRLRLTELQTR